MRRLFVGLAIIAIAVPAPLTARADDREIAQQIVDSLEAYKADGKLKDFNIGLRVENGAVYLSGSVASQAHERLALAAARRADGVQRIYNQLERESVAEVQPVSATAEVSDELHERAPKTLRIEGSLANYDEDGSIVTADLKRPADVGHAPARIVRTQRHDSMAEAKAIATEIIEQLRIEKNSGNLRGFGIDVEVDHGVVWLKGHVASREQQALALDIARRVPGVKQVVNDLTLSGRTHDAVVPASIERSDNQIAQEIVQSLQQQKDDGTLRNFGIDVQVDKGTVWMSGFVANAWQQKMALDVARYVDGVEQVVNDLTIRSNAIAPVTRHQPLANSYPYAPARSQRQLQAAAQTPLAFAAARPVSHVAQAQASTPVPMQGAVDGGFPTARYDHPQMPGYAWPSYAAHPNYGAVTYPRQYSASAWPYIGPFYPYPQVPLGWRKVSLEWDDGWWFLDFKDRH